MIDAAAAGESALAPASRNARAVQAEVHAPGARALDRYDKLAPRAVAGPAQGVHWVRAWITETNPDYLVAGIGLDGAPALALPLEIVREGMLTVARFMGGRHANGNFAPASPSFLAGATAADLHALVDAVRQARPDIDLVHLERQAREIAGHRNPFLMLPHLPSPNVALAVDLSDGFDAVIERAGGRRRRKKRRSQLRKFEEAGGWRRITADTPDAVSELLSAFLVMKRARFATMGVPDVFAPPEVRHFLKRLFTDALAGEATAYRLDALIVGDVIRAVTGSSAANGTLTCEFGAIREDELSSTSPGEFLFYDNIAEACARGFRIYDFSIGDEPYKRQWGAIELVQFDTLLPLTVRGRIAAAQRAATARVKRSVKNSPLVWPLVKRLRKLMTPALP